MKNIGIEMHKLCEKLFPICRSITGAGFRESLNILKNDMQLNDLNVFEVATGTKCFDWEVPKEWNIRDAYIITPDGKKIVMFLEVKWREEESGWEDHKYELWIMDIDGSNKKKLLGESKEFTLSSWIPFLITPDGKKIIFYGATSKTGKDEYVKQRRR